MGLFFSALAVFLVTGVVSLLGWKNESWSRAVGSGGAVLGCVAGLVAVLTGAVFERWGDLRLPLAIPYAEFYLACDGLSLFFLFLIFFVGLLGAIYGYEYMKPSADGESRRGWCAFNILLLSMALVVTAKNGILFLVAWELMTMSSFFLVINEDQPETEKSAVTYLIASHLAAAFLFCYFLMMAVRTGSFTIEPLPPGAASVHVLFAFALIGFGTKFGWVPFHVWLPEAHAAAPSHVSALMSGVMIKMGLYGLLRSLMILGPPHEAWAYAIGVLAVGSCMFAMLSALAERDFKRALAYSSVENAGVIGIGLSISLLGYVRGLPEVATVAIVGMLFHCMNHALFKSLMFFGAGALIHTAKTRLMAEMGGLGRRMPLTQKVMAVGAAALAGLPPLNGFVGELLIYIGVAMAVSQTSGWAQVFSVVALCTLAVTGALALVVFSKLVGAVLLGRPRTLPLDTIHEPGPFMKFPMKILAAACFIVGLAPGVFLISLFSVGNTLGLVHQASDFMFLDTTLGAVSFVGIFFLVVVFGLWKIRDHLLSRRSVRTGPTWDCGYHTGIAKAQYSPSSFSWPLLLPFGKAFSDNQLTMRSEDYFPATGNIKTHVQDVILEKGFMFVLSSGAKALAGWRRLQHGHIQGYLMYIILAFLCLMIWQMGIPS